MGSHNSIIALFEDVATDLQDGFQVGYGSADDFNSIRDKKYPYNWIDPITGGFPSMDNGMVGNTIEWQISMNFLKLDDKDGNEKETAVILGETFDLMEKYIHKLDREFINNETDSRIQSGNIQIKNSTFKSRRKGLTDFVSGWTLTFTLITQSEFDYCSIYE